MNKEDLKTEQIARHHLLVEEIGEMMTRSESAQWLNLFSFIIFHKLSLNSLFNARLQMIEALSKKEEKFKNAGVEIAIDQ